jgi:hypothetical protein
MIRLDGPTNLRCCFRCAAAGGQDDVLLDIAEGLVAGHGAALFPVIELLLMFDFNLPKGRLLHEDAPRDRRGVSEQSPILPSMSEARFAASL